METSLSFLKIIVARNIYIWHDAHQRFLEAPIALSASAVRLRKTHGDVPQKKSPNDPDSVSPFHRAAPLHPRRTSAGAFSKRDAAREEVLMEMINGSNSFRVAANSAII